MNDMNTMERVDPATLGDAVIANNMDGGHLAIVQGLPYPRWQVTRETWPADGMGSGIAIDLSRGAICRWLLVPHGDSLVGASTCGIRMKDCHLVIPAAYLLMGGYLDQERTSDFIAPILDHLLYDWGAVEDEPQEKGAMQAPITIDGRALDLLGALHGGAKVTETQEGWSVDRRTTPQRKDEEPRRIDVHAGATGAVAESAGSQLVHNHLARRSNGELVPTPAGRAVAAEHGYPAGPDEAWKKAIEPAAGPGVAISKTEIDEPYALDVRTTERLTVSRSEHGYRHDYDKVMIRIGEVASIEFDSSVAKTMVDHLSPTSVRGERFTVGLARGAKLSIGGKADGVIEVPGRDGDVRVTLGASTTRTLRSIMREAAKRGGSGNSIEDVPVVREARDAYYSRAKG